MSAVRGNGVAASPRCVVTPEAAGYLGGRCSPGALRSSPRGSPTVKPAEGALSSDEDASAVVGPPPTRACVLPPGLGITTASTTASPSAALEEHRAATVIARSWQRFVLYVLTLDDPEEHEGTRTAARAGAELRGPPHRFLVRDGDGRPAVATARRAARLIESVASSWLWLRECCLLPGVRRQGAAAMHREHVADAVRRCRQGRDIGAA